jgi:ATP-dependent DNA helicase Q1
MAASGSGPLPTEHIDLTGEEEAEEEEEAAAAAEEEAAARAHAPNGAAAGLQAQLSAVNAELEGVETQLQALVAQRASLRQQQQALRAGLDAAAAVARAGGGRDWQTGAFGHDGRVQAALRDVFKLTAFRGLQRGVVNATLSGVDALVILPAGGGKSLCYQLPAVLEARGYTLVISPLLSLIEDQVMALGRLGVHAAALTASTPREEASATMALLDDPSSTLRLLYVTPEKVVKSRRFFAKLEKAYKAGLLRRIAVDEAHCISQWGADFRVDYVKLHVLKEQFPNAPLLALTATATADVQASICDALSVAGAARFVGSVRRANLRYEVRAKPSAAAAHLDDLAALIGDDFTKTQSGIVYCLSRRDTEVVAAELCTRGICALAYHAQMETHARLAAHRSWAAGRTQVIVSTVAFGMVRMNVCCRMYGCRTHC